jgi:protein-tyrosine-phosphatase
VIRILVICTGNTCRSPLAEALLRRQFQERSIEGVTIASAGTGAWDGAPASEGAYLVGLEHGLDLSAHRAQLLTRELVQDADMVFTMARHHRARVEQLGGAGKTHLLGEYAGFSGDDAEVNDPFGGELEGYRETVVDLIAMTAAVADRVVRERSGDRR